MPSLIDLMLEGRKVPQHSPWPRAMVDADLWKFAAGELAQGRWSLLDLWAEPASVHMAIMDGQTAEIATVSLDCPNQNYPSVGLHHPPALRLERAINDLFGTAKVGLDTYWHNRVGLPAPSSAYGRSNETFTALAVPAIVFARSSSWAGTGA
jgi:hypothetical protein